MDAAKGHQAQIREAQVAADELVTHAQQAQLEAQREAASWRAQVLPAASCTHAALWWGNQTHEKLCCLLTGQMLVPLCSLCCGALRYIEIAALCFNTLFMS